MSTQNLTAAQATAQEEYDADEAAYWEAEREFAAQGGEDRAPLQLVWAGFGQGDALAEMEESYYQESGRY